MQKNSKITEAYQELGRIGRGPMTPEAIGKIRKALTGSTSLLVSRAADIASEHGLQDLVPEMIAAFPRFMEDGAKVDKGCRAKTSIVNALNKLEHMGDAVFMPGARYVQMEASFGPPEDTAVELRSACAFALARINHPDAHFVLADLLMDSQRSVRVAAVKALAYLGEHAGELMLRVKVLSGDPEPEVLGECFLGLMTMAPGRSLPFVSRYLDSWEPLLLESAAIAIGNSHLPEALATLCQVWNQNPYPKTRRALLVPIALIRSDEAFAFLLEVVRTADAQLSDNAVTALHLYTGDNYVTVLEQAIAKRREGKKER